MKPKCSLVGEDGNIFNLMSIAAHTLKCEGMYEQATEMCEKISKAKSYEAAIYIISQYVDIV